MALSPARARATARAIRLARTKPAALVQFQLDPLAFAVDVLKIRKETLAWTISEEYGEHVWDGTRDPLMAAFEALARGENVGIESATGTGKSFILAIIYLWFLASWEDSRVFTFAPTEKQLRLYSWMEVTRMWPKFTRHFRRAVQTDLRIRMVPGSDSWGAWGFPVRKRAGEEVAVGAAGMHAPHMLLVYEETPGMDNAVLEAGRQTCTAEHNIMFAVGNPDHQQDALHLHCERKSVRHIRISALDHPNLVTGRDIVPGAVSPISEQTRREDLGVDHRLYKSRIRGLSPKEASDALIKSIWIEEAVEKAKDPAWREFFRNNGGRPALGVDVANSESGDQGAIARGIGALCEEVVAFPCPNSNKLGTRVAAEMAIQGINVRNVGVDPGGVGAGCVNELTRLKLYVRHLHASGKVEPRIDEDVLRDEGIPVSQAEKFLNKRAQMWWQGAEDLRRGRVGLPDDPELARDLVTPLVIYDLGRIKVQPKEEIIEKLGRSPNKGDAWIFWNWVRHRRAVVEEEEVFSAFSAEALEHEARESRRVRTPKKKRSTIPPTAVERVK